MISSNLIGFPLLQFVGSRWLHYRNLTGSINHAKVDARAFREAIDGVRRGRRTVDPSYRDRTSPGEGVRISREYLFLLACYDFRASDIYYIRHSAFHAKIAFLPRVQYDNSSSLKQRYTRCSFSSKHSLELAYVSSVRQALHQKRILMDHLSWSPLIFEFEYLQRKKRRLLPQILEYRQYFVFFI